MSMLQLLVLCTSMLAIATSSDSAKWSYRGEHGPSHWTSTYSECGKDEQSPISIPLDAVVPSSDIAPLTLGPGLRQQLVFNVKNNGHTVVASPSPKAQESMLTMHGANLPGSKYSLVNLHVHFGSTSMSGSEHTVSRGEQTETYPGELHMVFYNTKYDDSATAMVESDGLAVIGTFLTEKAVATLDIPFFKASVLGNVISYEENFSVNLTMTDYLPKNISGFFRYNGSLTTPPCYQSVNWILMHDQISVTPVELNRLRDVQPKKGTLTKDGKIEIIIGSSSIADNNRPTQALNGRRVLSRGSWAGKLYDAGASAVRPALVIVAALLMSLL